MDLEPRYVRMMDDNLRVRGLITSPDCTLVGYHLHLSRTHMRNLRSHDQLGTDSMPIDRFFGVPVFEADCDEPIEHNTSGWRIPAKYLQWATEAVVPSPREPTTPDPFVSQLGTRKQRRRIRHG
jgi:hypothetical protein